MRHNKHKNKLGLKKSHRLSVVRNLITQLLQHEQITTTLARAKNIRLQIDKIVTLAKRKDLASKKRVIAFLKNKVAVAKLYQDYLAIYQDRTSGFTRSYRLKNRLGDNAFMVLVSMVDNDKIVKQAEVSEVSTLKKVKEDIEKTEDLSKTSILESKVITKKKEPKNNNTLVKEKNLEKNKQNSVFVKEKNLEKKE